MPEANVQQRIELLDALRGFAILGTLGTNIWLFVNAGNIGALFGSSGFSSGAEQIIQQATLFFTNGKFLGMLTILFGVGLELQYQSARRRGTGFLMPYLWRATLLFLDGLIHFFLILEFDILMGYAVTAMLVAFIVTRGERLMWTATWLALGVHVVLVSALTAFLILTPAGDLERALGDTAQISRVYLNGSYPDDVMYRAANFWSLRAEAIFVIPMGVVLFLFGVRLMRAGAFTNTPEGSRITGLMLRWGLGLGLPLNLLALEPSLGLDIAARYVFAPILAVGYIGVIAHVVRNGWLSRAVSAVARVGRMALSNYMLQGVLASVLFYGWGFGFAQTPNAFVALGAWLGIAIVLIVFSKFWLSRFKQGPFETIWKRLSEAPFKQRRLEETA
jgi:uncharacterized protein